MTATLQKYAARPFDYESDCARFVGECLGELHGRNPIAALKYRTEREAYRLIRQFGGLRGAISHYLGQPLALPLPPPGVMPGDVCLIAANNGREALGMCFRWNNSARIVARVQTGLMDYPPARALAVWRP